MNLVAIVLTLSLFSPATDPFAIEVVDSATGRGIPLVELITVNNTRFITDNAGLAAISDVDLMGHTIYFHVKSHGYEYAKDGFGFRGKALKVAPGSRVKLVMTRINVAERLYRVTGGGLYRDTVALGQKAPLAQPLLNAQVFGSDSVLTTLYQGKIHWFWGDTNRPDYPLGNFHTPGATSRLPSDGGLDPSVGVDLTYWTDPKTGFAKPTAQLPGDGPTWLDGLVVLDDAQKGERMFAFYAKIRPPMETYERGLAEWDTRTKQFQKVTAFATNAPVNPGSLPIGGHPFLHTDQGIRYIYYANPYPLTRVRAEPDELKDPANFERFTCLEPAKPGEESAVARDADGKVLYAWKRGAPGVGPAEQAVLIKAGKLKPGEGLIQLCDVETGKPVQAHGGSVAWNEYRKRWVMIAVEFGGSSSLLGEVWFAEADEPTGPWAYARKVATHEKYSYYNPRHHPFFNQKNGRLIYFEGTYTNTFSGNLDQTPRYDYNQMMYRLDLGDDRLNLPVAVVLPSEPERLTKSQHGLTCPVEFLALDHAGEGTVPIFTDPRSTLHAAFHILPIGSANASKTTTSLYQFIHEGENQMFYSIDPTWSAPGFKRTEQPVGLVWRNPRS